MAKIKYIHIPEEHNTKAATIVVPQFINLYSPKSVVDIGCGLGTWLKVFEDHGVNDILGYDGSHLDLSKIAIDKSKIVIADLEKEIKSDKTFDLAISLEVAEHISEKSAENFVKSLCNLSQTIIFSAAIPQQGGQNHINEQWPEYWQNLFLKHGYTSHDSLRELFWEHNQVDYWYKQNMFLVTGPKSPFYSKENKPIRKLVHPELLDIYYNTLKNISEGKVEKKQALKYLIKSVIRKK
ncbi:class I SAM-dependent methyltransferase [Aurantibacillus circumpalustris]|uniref:class I SAM-dependent methyltransferase n=1 Tax=Aurantibacillus circumpalustris TaxID=3036359 RepID=UPI00295C2958|nr:class I SAM-dependent methyltransferase [Aurantibacillus circumpalustris]